MRIRYSPALLAVLLLSTASRAAAQATTAVSRAPKLTCDYALRLLTAEATDAPVDTTIFVFESRRDADAALYRLTNLALRSPRCPAAYGVRGLVKQRLAQTDWIPKDAPGQRAGVVWKEDAVYDLANAAKTGGRGAAAAATVATKILLPKHVERPDLVRQIGPWLLNVPSNAGEVPDTIRNFHRGRLAAWLWRPQVADSAFAAYLAAGGAPERAKLELGRLRLALGAAGADTLYYQAAASADPEIVRDLRADLAFVADTEQLGDFDRAAAAARPGWLRRFWEQRDLESLRPRGSRLREHYRRIGVARQEFRLLSYPRHYELNELWINRDAEYDDRGLVYIRHGPPDATAGATRAGGCPNTSWLYRRAEGNLIFHFVARQNPDDWRLVETLANLAGERGATTRLRQAGSERSCGALDGLLESRVALDPIYVELSGNGSRRNWERELALTTRSREIGTTTDSDPLRYRSSLAPAWRAYGLLGSSAGQGRAVVLVSIPATTLKPVSLDPLAYGFRMRLVARSGSRVVELDTLRMLGVPEPPQPGQMVTFTTNVPLSAGAWSLGVVLEQQRDSAGEVLRDPEVPIPDVSGKTLALSDIVLGDATGGRPWTAPDGPFPLSATGTFVRGEPVPIYYELVGARAGSEVKSEITLVREDGKGRSVIGFSERMEGSVRRVRREVNTSRSEPGRYTMTVKVTAEGRNAQRQTSLLLVEKGSDK